MTKSEPTPGPWEINPEDPFEIISKEWGGIASVPNEPAENKALMDMTRSNARLIASAPDLLEALKRFIDHQTQWLEEQNKDLAIQAIQKAEGI